MITARRVSNGPTNGKSQSLMWVNGLEPNEARYDDRLQMLFQADTLISEQYYATYKRTGQLSPEKTLMLAVLQDAIACFKYNLGARDKTRRDLFRDAEEWILATDRSYFFSFENVCDALGFDASFLRQGLVQWKAVAVKTLRAREAAKWRRRYAMRLERKSHHAASLPAPVAGGRDRYVLT